MRKRDAEKLNLIRIRHLLRRVRYDEDEGRWVTTENDHKIHINEKGEIDKGNPYVLKAIQSGQERSKRLSDVRVGGEFMSRGYHWKKTGDDEYTNTETGETTNARGIKEYKDDSFTVADLNKTRVEDYPFSGGQAEVTRRTAPAYVYEAPNGLKIVMPVGMSRQKQKITLERLVEQYNSVPTDIQRKAQKTIVLQDVYNPRDSYWRQQYKGFGHSYATGGDEIDFWRYDQDVPDSQVRHTLLHEMAHIIDLGGSMRDENGEYKRDSDRMSTGKLWRDAVAKDRSVGATGSPTPYGNNAPWEDFAESFALFVTQREFMENNYPGRTEAIKTILRERKGKSNGKKS